MTETILGHARLVLSDRVVDGGVTLRDGVIVAVDTPSRAGAIDLDGDLLLPGVVDVHTDNLERQVLPRASARWPSRSAMLAHDAQCAVAGVTTVLDALCLGDLGFDNDRIRTFSDGVADLTALAGTGMLRAEHFLHLRCELPAEDMLPMFHEVADHPLVRMVSLMDHVPGVGQYSDLDRYRAMRIADGHAPAAVERQIVAMNAQRDRLREPNRAALLARIAGRGVALASHDDGTEAEVADNDRLGIRISEFPVSLVAARAARARGMTVIAGAPNVVRRGSHSGNVSALALIVAGLVDALASDYVPSAMLEAAFVAATVAGVGLPAAVAMISDAPARMAGLPDRGRIAVGMRADLVRVRLHDGIPVPRATWRGGERVA